MADVVAPAMDAWTGLIEETREALASLRADDLEVLAARVETAWQQAGDVGREMEPFPATTLHELAKRHRLLGDLLQATERNLAVLRRLRGEPVEARWVR